eukprot:COSAG06_NODE_23445_length_691_cov_1.912162_2_plen_71_part_01
MAAVANPANRPNRYLGTGWITSQIVILSLFYINPYLRIGKNVQVLVTLYPAAGRWGAALKSGGSAQNESKF